MAAATQPVFYYDLGSPESYIVAEQVMAALPVVPEWEPILAADLPGPPPDTDPDRLERWVAELGLQPLRWPAARAPDTRTAMLAATYAKHIGRAVAFSLAAFRQAFAGGRDLAEADTVLIAGAACEMHPTALLKAIGLRSVTDGLAAAGARAQAVGVRTVPAIEAAGEVHHGLDGLRSAAAALGGSDAR